MGWWEDMFRPINFGKPDEKKRKEVMNRGYGFSNKDQMGDLYKRNQYQPGKTALTASASRGVVPRPSDLEMEVIQRRPEPPRTPRYANKQQFDQDNYPGNPSPKVASPLEVLMERLSQGYQGTDPSQIDFSALDKALESRLGALTGARNQIRGNFDKSDVALEGMHRAFENQVRTEDAARYNQIADQQKGNLNANAQQGVSALEASRAKQTAERQAMLQNLGIQEAGRAEDTSLEGLNEGIDTINQRNNINQNLAEQQRGTNLAYNNTVAQSIGQAGVARRSALQQQLQALMGKVDMAEAEARSQNEIERSRQMSQANSAGYDQWNDQQNRYMDMFQILNGNEIAREKMAMQNLPSEVKPSGLNRVAADLEMSGSDPAMAQRGLAALSQILSEGNYLEGANGPEGNTPYDRVNIITQKLKARGVDPMTATAIGISYGNL